MQNKEIVLVTGGTGYIAMQIIFQLLKKGYKVRATVRNLKNVEKVKETLTNNGISTIENLSFVETELTSDDNWEKAMDDCQYVLSVASPVFFDNPQNEEDAILPAKEGILRILKFAKCAGVKRVIMTSNFGAIGFTQTDKGRVTTEEDWTDTNQKGVSVYEKSKTLAEKAAWEYIKTQGNGLEFATINPVAILGPSLNAHISGSFHLLQNLISGKMKAIPNIPLNIVDVRDVADLHIRAMETPEANGHRFIATADGQISLPEIAQLLKSKRESISEKVSLKRLPNWVLNVASLFNDQAKEGVLLSKMNRNVSNQKARKILKWTPLYTQENTILEAVDTMKKYGLIIN